MAVERTLRPLTQQDPQPSPFVLPHWQGFCCKSKLLGTVASHTASTVIVCATCAHSSVIRSCHESQLSAISRRRSLNSPLHGTLCCRCRWLRCYCKTLSELLGHRSNVLRLENKHRICHSRLGRPGPSSWVPHRTSLLSDPLPHASDLFSAGIAIMSANHSHTVPWSSGMYCSCRLP